MIIKNIYTKIMLLLFKSKKEGKLIKTINYMSIFLIIILISILLIKCIEFKSLYIFLIWFIFFTGIHYIFIHTFKCPVSLTPIVSIATITFFLYLSGIFNLLLYGFYIIIIFGLVGLFLIIIKKRALFFKEILFQPPLICCYYVLAFLLFVQCNNLCNDFVRTDDRHHWGLIINGMCHYNRLSDFPRLTNFDDYTLGSTIWAYFINKISLLKFKIWLSCWANSLLLISCFIPGLSVFKLVNRKSIIPIIFLLSSFVFICYGDLFTYRIFGIFFFITSFITFKIKNEEININTLNEFLSICSYYLFYSALLIAPNLEGSFYRSIKPDIAIYAVAASALLTYLSKPTFKTVFWITPVLALAYLIKTPGLFLSISVSFSIIIHLFCLHKNRLYKSISNKIKIYHVFIIALILIILSLTLPPIIWLKHCKNHKIKINDYSKISIHFIEKCYFDTTNDGYKKIRNEFLNKFLHSSIFLMESNNNKYINPIYYCKKIFNSITSNKLTKNNQICISYSTSIIVIIIFYFLYSIITLNINNRYLGIIFFILLLSTCLFISSLLIHYCYSFGERNIYQVLSFERYSSPVLKILLLYTIYLFILFSINQKTNNKIRTFISILLFFLSLSFATCIGFKTHIADYKVQTWVKSLLNSIPSKFDFYNKTVGLVLNNRFYENDFDNFGSIFMNYSYSFPQKIYLFSNDIKNMGLLNKVDYIIYLNDGDTNFLKIASNFFLSKHYLSSNDFECFYRSCILEKQFESKKIKFKCNYLDSHKPKNLLKSINLKDEILKWHTNSSNVYISNPNDRYINFSKNDTYIYRNIDLSSNHYYRLSFSVKGKFYNNICAYVDNLPIKVKNNNYNKWRSIQFYLLSDKNFAKIKFIGGSNSGTSVKDICIFDLGEANRNVNK